MKLDLWINIIQQEVRLRSLDRICEDIRFYNPLPNCATLEFGPTNDPIEVYSFSDFIKYFGTIYGHEA